MQIFNPNNLRNKQRFPVAIIAGVLAAIVGALGCMIIETILASTVGVIFSIVYVGVAYLIGNAIKHYGRGVDLKFSIVSVVCFVLSIFLTDLFHYIYSTSMFDVNLIVYSIRATVQSFASFGNINSLFRLVILAYAGYIAYYTARIV